MKTYLNTLLLFVLSLSAHAHNMPIEVKKEKVIEILLESEGFDSSGREALEKGTFELNSSEALFSPFIYFNAGPEIVNYYKPGDQDYEEFFFNFTYNGRNFLYNCGLHTEELIDQNNIDYMTYTIAIRDCKITNLNLKISKYKYNFNPLEFRTENAF